MPAELERILIVPDTHAPYHDNRAVNLMLAAVDSAWGHPDGLIHMGDLGDFYKLATFSKDPGRKETLADECESARYVRMQLDDLKPGWKQFIEGNHEDRIRRYLMDTAPELFGEVTTDSLLELTEHGWGFTPYREYFKVGKVHFTHDTGDGGQYATRRSLDAFQSSVVIGHHHNQTWLVEGDATGEHHVAAQFGWLGDVNHAEYMQRVKALRKWSLGFGLGYHNKRTGTVYLVPTPIIKYRCMIEGVEYRG